MIVTLRLEYIGEHLDKCRRWHERRLENMRIGSREWVRLYRALEIRRRPWVARMDSGERVFVEGKKDYSRANRDGSRGVFMYYHLPPGRYEIRHLNEDDTERRYTCRVELGRIIED